MDEQTFDDVLSSALAPYEEQPHNATVAITNALPLVSTVVPEKSGRIFNHRAITERVKQQVSSLSFDTPRFTSDIFTPTISVCSAQKERV
jgi:peroxiredoxin